ncbi:MAG: thiolase family protein [Caulobacterales bacterium]|nr:thiolase family protein [Caulobacterales bacterium]
MKGSRVAVVGVGETAYVRATDRSLMSLMVEASHKAIADAGLEPSDIDGMIDCGASCHLEDLAFSMGFGDLAFTAAASVVAGTATVGAGLELAQLAIDAGLARHVLVPYGLKCSKPGGPRTLHASEPLKADLEMPVGYFGQPAYFAVVANRYRHEHGLTEEELAAVSITTRAWAALTPQAQKRDPLDLAAYRKSPMVATPLRTADCCLMTDGAGAYVVSAVERARDLPHTPVVVAGIGIGTNPWPQSMVLTQNPDLMALPGAKSAAKAYAMAGLAAKDLDLAQVYDCFSISMLLQTEMLGLAGPGEGGRFYASGAGAPGGRMPVNTSGGHLAGGYVPGVNLLIEAVRQLRGDRGAAQVADARVAAVAGLGGNSHATAILTRGL